jgi:hypothetical protein
MLDDATTAKSMSGGFRHGIPVAEVQNPQLLKGLELWRRQRGNERFPSRARMSPRLLAGLLRNTVLVRVKGEDFEFRIVGDAIVTAQGASFQGMTTAEIDKIVPGYGRTLGKVYRHVCTTGEPSAYRGWFERGADGRAFFHESLVMPLGEDGKHVDHLLILGVYAYNDDLSLR